MNLTQMSLVTVGEEHIEIKEPSWKEALVMFSELGRAGLRAVSVDSAGVASLDPSKINVAIMESVGLAGYMASKCTGKSQEWFDSLPLSKAAGVLAVCIETTFTPELLGNVSRIVQGAKPALLGAFQKRN